MRLGTTRAFCIFGAKFPGYHHAMGPNLSAPQRFPLNSTYSEMVRRVRRASRSRPPIVEYRHLAERREPIERKPNGHGGVTVNGRPIRVQRPRGHFGL
jgi:hypothetical protein